MLVVNFFLETKKKKTIMETKKDTLGRKYPRKQNEIRNRNERNKNLDCNNNDQYKYIKTRYPIKKKKTHQN